MKFEKAVKTYASKLNNCEEIELDYFKSRLSEAEYKEFLEFRDFLRVAKSTFREDEFENIIDNINVYRLKKSN